MMTTLDETRLVKRYARAWMNCFNTQIDDADIRTFHAVIAYFKEHPRIYFMLKLSIIKDETKRQALHMLNTLYDLPVGFFRLCDLLVKQKRSFLLTAILAAIITQYWQLHNIERFNVVSARALLDSQKEECQAFLMSLRDKKVQCTYEVDADLIAGIRMQSDYFLWEHSMSRQIRKIRQSLVR